MRLALAQLISDSDPAANLDQVAELTAQAAAQGAELVVFPEATMRCFGRSLTEVAEPLDGPWAAGVRRIAAEHGVAVAVGMFTPSEDGRVRNTLLVVGPELDEHYDKIHLFDAFGFAESDTVEPGDATHVVTVDGVGVGLSVCYDIRFPGQYTALATAGARITLCSASWGAGEGKVDQWRLLARARALDSTTFLFAVGQADPEVEGVEVKPGAPTGVGHSLLVGPDGTVRAEAGAGSELLVVDVDDDEVTGIRKVIPVLANGRVTEPSGGQVPR